MYDVRFMILPFSRRRVCRLFSAYRFIQGRDGIALRCVSDFYLPLTKREV